MLVQLATDSNTLAEATASVGLRTQKRIRAFNSAAFNTRLFNDEGFAERIQLSTLGARAEANPLGSSVPALRVRPGKFLACTPAVTATASAVLRRRARLFGTSSAAATTTAAVDKYVGLVAAAQAEATGAATLLRNATLSTAATGSATGAVDLRVYRPTYELSYAVDLGAVSVAVVARSVRASVAARTPRMSVSVSNITARRD